MRAPIKTLEDDLTDHSYTIYDGDVPLYTVDLEPSADAYNLTLHAGSGNEGAIVAGASWQAKGKEMRFALSPSVSGDPQWEPVSTNINKSSRSFGVPGGSRTFVAKNTTDNKLGCSGLSEFDQKVIDASTHEICAIFLWNTEKASFTHERKRATIKWCVELSREAVSYTHLTLPTIYSV